MSDSCADCVKKDAEILALRKANQGLRLKIREQEIECIEVETQVLATYAAYDRQMSQLRTAVAQTKAEQAKSARAELKDVAAGTPTG